MSVDGTVISLGSRKQRAVLAVLLVNRNRAVGSDELISAVWENRPPTNVRSALHTYMSNLRRLITSSDFDARAVLASAPPGYRLSLPDSDFDLGRFVTSSASGFRASANGQFDQASRSFAEALAEWRGPALDDLRDFTFFEAFATALAEDRLTTQIGHAEAEIACGRSRSIVNTLEALTAEHPYHEPLWAQLVTAYYLAERQSSALDAYHRLRSALAEDLGIDPGPTVQALYEKVLRQERLDVGKATRARADDTIIALQDHVSAVTEHLVGPVLRGADGTTHPLMAMSTRIGRSPDNNIVLADAKVSRHHAAIIDTGSNFVIADLRSANGVYVGGRRIRASAVLVNGDVIRIGDNEFTFYLSTPDSVSH